MDDDSVQTASRCSSTWVKLIRQRQLLRAASVSGNLPMCHSILLLFRKYAARSPPHHALDGRLDSVVEDAIRPAAQKATCVHGMQASKFSSQALQNACR